MKDLKGKTIRGLIWNFLERFFRFGIQFVVGIILARILSPKEFGLMGMLAIFISLSQVLIDSGLQSAIIRKQNISEKDYHTVFVFNILSSIVFFLILMLLSYPVSRFYRQPLIQPILVVIAVGLMLEAAGSIHAARLNKKMDFKALTKISIVASSVSGVLAIIMAKMGYGIWSLVALNMIRVFITTMLLWIFSKWKPRWQFDKESFQELFSFGNKLLISGLVDTVYNKGFYMLIGKIYSPAQLGYFNRGERFQSIISENITGWVSKVSYPMLTQINDKARLKKTYKSILKNMMFISFLSLLGLAAISESLIITLLGEKWRQTVPYLQYLVFSGIWLPVQALNTDVLKVFGRSDLFLKVVLIKKSIAIPLMIITALISIKAKIYGMIFMAVLSYVINVYWSNKFVKYPLKEQVTDMLPSFFLALANAFLMYITGKLLQTSPLVTLWAQVGVGFLFIILYGELTHHNIYRNLKKTIFEILKRKAGFES